MGFIAPDESSVKSAVMSFEALLSESPELAKLARQTARETSGYVLEALTEEDEQVTASEKELFVLALQKLVFLHTDPEDHCNTIGIEDLQPVIGLLYAEKGTIRGTAEALDHYANFSIMYRQKQFLAVEQAVRNMMLEYQIFWTTFGVFLAYAEIDHTDARRTT
jgi:hypothetical protein